MIEDVGSEALFALLLTCTAQGYLVETLMTLIDEEQGDSPEVKVVLIGLITALEQLIPHQIAVHAALVEKIAQTTDGDLDVAAIFQSLEDSATDLEGAGEEADQCEEVPTFAQIMEALETLERSLLRSSQGNPDSTRDLRKRVRAAIGLRLEARRA